jgi:hypothetical protein
LSSTTNPLPSGAIATVVEQAMPTALQGDALEPAFCSVAVPPGVVASDLTLGFNLKVPPPAAATLFSYDASKGVARAVPSQVVQSRG